MPMTKLPTIIVETVELSIHKIGKKIAANSLI